MTEGANRPYTPNWGKDARFPSSLERREIV